MSTHVLLNLLNELGKVIKCEADRSFYRFFAASLINPLARMSDSIYHMTLKTLKNCIFVVKTSRLSLISSNVIMDVIASPENLYTTSGLSIVLHGVISLSGATLCYKI